MDFSSYYQPPSFFKLSLLQTSGIVWNVVSVYERKHTRAVFLRVWLCHLTCSPGHVHGISLFLYDCTPCYEVLWDIMYYVLWSTMKYYVLWSTPCCIYFSFLTHQVVLWSPEMISQLGCYGLCVGEVFQTVTRKQVSYHEMVQGKWAECYIVYQ